MRTKLSLILALICSIPAYGESCLKYEPENVSLSGNLQKEVFPGAPNFESIEDGDTPETYYILHLSTSICVSPSQDEVNSFESDVYKVQLALQPSQDQALKSKLGSSIALTGTLFHQISGHHHTKVLMTVSDIK